MKNRLSIIVSLISLAGVLVIAGIWIFGSIKISVVSLDTFIGICVALMAIVFTVIVGLQIVNAIDMKERISETERKQKEQIEIERRLAENDLIQTKQVNNLQAGICSTNGDLYRVQNNLIEAFWCYHSALYHSIIAGTPKLEARINTMRIVAGQISSKPSADFSILLPQIVFEYSEIKKTDVYRNYLSSDYDAIMMNFENKMKVLGLIPSTENYFSKQHSLYESPIKK